jgi:mediator of RNA polymerase II transcription subunit 16, fungi type
MGDGTIDFRDRESLDPVGVDPGLLDVQDPANLPEIRCMPQIGFSFPVLESSLQVALSPSYCMAAVLKKDGLVDLKGMEYNLVPLRDLKPDDAKFHSVIVSMALQHGTSLLSYKTTDDLLAILPKDITEDFKIALVQQCRRALRMNYDLVTDEGAKNIAHLHKLAPLYRCMSIQNTLGVHTNGIRNLRAKLAWITLNLRFSCLVLANTLKPNESLRADMATSLIGQLRWGLDFFVYILQELFDLSYKMKGREGDLEFVQETLVRENSPALFVLLSSFTRVMLQMLSRPIRHGWIHAQNGAKTAIPNDQRLTFNKMMQLYRGAPLNIGAFQAYLGEIDALVKESYTKAGLTELQKTRLENEIFQRVEIPSELAPAVNTILTTSLQKLMQASEPGNVHNYDISWLGFTDDRRSRQMQERVVIDVIRKMPMGKDTRLRRCTRCLSVMEDINPQSVNYQAWVSNSQKSCVCFSSWVVLPSEKA